MQKIILFLTLSFYTTLWAYAAITVDPPVGVDLPTINETPDLAIAAIIQYFILITGILAVMAITWWGIKFILSTGDDEKMKKARYTIIYAFVGVVVAGLAYSIVEVLTKIEL
jgi:Type IV secretion system pilin